MDKLKVLKNVDLTGGAAGQVRALNSETTNFSKFEVSHGHGRLLKAGVVLQKGVTGTVTVDISVTSYKQSSYEKATDEVRVHIDQKIVDELDECVRKGSSSDWWLWFHSGSASEYETHKKQTHEVIEDHDTTKVDALEKHFSEEKQEYHVSGTFQVEGLSMTPTEVYLYVEMLTIKTEDGSNSYVFNSSAIAADESGDTSAARVKDGGKLNILPL